MLRFTGHRAKCLTQVFSPRPTPAFDGTDEGGVDQNAGPQLEALRTAGCERVLVDPGVSGTRTSRPKLDRMLEHLREGQDEVVVWKLDRLGRKTGNLLSLIDGLGVRGFHFRSLTEGIATTGPMGKAVLTVMSRSPGSSAASWPGAPASGWRPLPTATCQPRAGKREVPPATRTSGVPGS